MLFEVDRMLSTHCL